MSARSFRREAERRRRAGRITGAAGIAAGAAAVLAPAAQAANIPVTNLNDDNAGSLRAAAVLANNDPALDTITFQAGLTGTITLTTGLISVTEPVDIQGPGAAQIAVSGNDASRIFSANMNVGSEDTPVTISGLTVTDGVGPVLGGAITNVDSAMTISGAVVQNSAASPMAGVGGGISTTGGDLTVRDSTISGNTAISEVSGGGYGGGIYAGAGDVSIVNSTISGNNASLGGGIATRGAATLAVTASTISGNQTQVGAGGIQDDSSGAVTLQSALLADNDAPDLESVNTNAGFSLIEDPSMSNVSITGPNITGQDPQLQPLGVTGGSTATQDPSLTSPALDKGLSTGLGTDQRGLQRIVDLGPIANASGGDASDIGAVERDSLQLNPGPVVGQENPKRICLGETVTLLGTPGKDKLRGTDEKDVIRGLRGNDKIRGLGGDDVICGDKGTDRVSAGGGNDLVRGGNGGDRLSGGPGDDVLRGGSGFDSIFGGGDSDSMFGGSTQGKASKGPAPSGGGNLCNGGPGADNATGCEIVEEVP